MQTKVKRPFYLKKIQVLLSSLHDDTNGHFTHKFRETSKQQESLHEKSSYLSIKKYLQVFILSFSHIQV